MKTIRFRTAAHAFSAPDIAEEGEDLAGGWQVRTWLGAPATGGLALPAAHPTASWLYAPRGVHLGRFQGRDILVAADTGNHRVLIWHSIPDRDEQPCDVVLGQPDAQSEGPAAGGTDTRNGLYLPTGVLVHDDMLLVADAWHHRILVYSKVPEEPGVAPDLVLGQPDPVSVEPNRGGTCAVDSFYWPFGIAVVDGRFYVADTGNRRVLGWSAGIPSSPEVEPDLVLGQPDPDSREENRNGPVCPSSFRWPHAITGTGDQLLVADAGNHRVLGWSPHPAADRDADLVIGQADFVTAAEWPYPPQPMDRTRFPYSVDVDEGRLAISDTANNRILWWDRTPSTPGVVGAADAVLGQHSRTSNGENRWSLVTRDTMCWPYGLSLRGNLLAVADSGNNRIVLWERS